MTNIKYGKSMFFCAKMAIISLMIKKNYIKKKINKQVYSPADLSCSALKIQSLALSTMLGSCEPASAALSNAWAASWCFKKKRLSNHYCSWKFHMVHNCLLNSQVFILFVHVIQTNNEVLTGNPVLHKCELNILNLCQFVH